MVAVNKVVDVGDAARIHASDPGAPSGCDENVVVYQCRTERQLKSGTVAPRRVVDDRIASKPHVLVATIEPDRQL